MLAEACDLLEVFGNMYEPPSSLNGESDIQDLRRYLGRMRPIDSGTVPTTRSNFVTKAITDSAMEVFIPDLNERLSGAHGVRFSMVFTLQASASPFNSALIAMGFQPTVGGYTMMRQKSEVVTNLPHVRLDVSEKTMVQLKVPFVYSKDYYPVEGGYDIGYIFVNNLTSVVVPTGGTPITYRLFLHLEDVELVGAMPIKSSLITLQSGKLVKPMDKEFETEAYPYSSATSALARTLKFVKATKIPLISSIAGTASWYAERTAGAIRAFGYSKPNICDPPARTYESNYVHEDNVDVASQLVNFGASIDNRIQINSAMAYSDVDQMSFDYIATQFSQINNLTLNITDTSSTVLYRALLTPSAMWWRPAKPNIPICRAASNNVAGGIGAFMPSSLMNLASVFRCWRGGFKFRFSFAKTKLHSGRVMAVFTPFTTLGGSFEAPLLYSKTPVYDSVAKTYDTTGYTAVFDLKEGSVFEFDIPYSPSQPYLDFFEHMGTLSLIVLDPLRSASTLSPTVGVVVEVAGMSGFEFANPIGPRFAKVASEDFTGYPNVTTAPLRVGIDEPAEVVAEVVLQSGKLVPIYKDDVCQFTMGERLNSVKQLISIPTTRMCYFNTTSQVFAIPPWFYSNKVGSGTRAGSFAFSYGGFFANCYQFCNGGTDLHLYDSPAGSNDSPSTVFVSKLNYEPRTETSGRNRGTGPIISMHDRALHARLPVYAKQHRYHTWDLDSCLWNPRRFNLDYSAKQFHAYGDYSTFYSCAVTGPVEGYRLLVRVNASDDASLGFYLGPQPLAFTYSDSAYDPTIETV